MSGAKARSDDPISERYFQCADLLQEIGFLLSAYFSVGMADCFDSEDVGLTVRRMALTKIPLLMWIGGVFWVLVGAVGIAGAATVERIEEARAPGAAAMNVRRCIFNTDTCGCRASGTGLWRSVDGREWQGLQTLLAPLEAPLVQVGFAPDAPALQTNSPP